MVCRLKKSFVQETSILVHQEPLMAHRILTMINLIWKKLQMKEGDIYFKTDKEKDWKKLRS